MSSLARVLVALVVLVALGGVGVVDATPVHSAGRSHRPSGAARPHSRGREGASLHRQASSSSSPSLSDLPAPGQNWGNPVASPAAVVVAPGGRARFTVLTPSLIRMQYAHDGNFVSQDVQTYVVLNRALDVPPFTQAVSGPVLTLRTAHLVLTYDSSDSATSSFSAANLQVVVTNADAKGHPSTWNAGVSAGDAGNLFGTVRTLDGSTGLNTPLDCSLNYDPNSHCSWGIIGTNGYAVIDDTGAPAFDAPVSGEWTWLRSRGQAPAQPSQCGMAVSARRDCGFGGIAADECVRRGCCFDSSVVAVGVPQCFYTATASQDLYFLGHGRDFKGALRDYTSIAGKIPAPPRYMFGVYFSRYWAYADYEEYQLVQEYIDHQLPLDILVTDMDWHKTFYSQSDRGVEDQAGQRIGWTGFTFDQHLFPNITEFFLWCKGMGLRNTLNLHPASGIQPWEEQYEAMARAMGQDPSTGKFVPYNATDFKYNTAWMQLVMSKLEQTGVDFWWLDWQQGEQWIDEARLNPTQMLNYVFYSNPTHWYGSAAGKRPAILHRWGGLGNHRFQVGFSGDVIPSWTALAFQPYFTATAANVGYGYWSHDLGGHTQMPAADLYTRWIQFGTFSPVFRTHCTKDGDNDRRIWMFPDDNYRIMAKFTRLRAALVPYLADHALYTYDTGLSLLLPLYYDYPLHDEAYPASGLSDTTYKFGHSLLISPIVAPVDDDTQLAFKTLWAPPGRWVGFFSGDVMQSPADGGIKVEVNSTLAEMPAWAAAGSIIPLRPLPPTSAPGSALVGSAQQLPSTLQLLTFVGGTPSGSLTLREDSGDDLAYQTGQWATTEVSYELMGEANTTLLYTIAQTQVYAGFMVSRSYEVHLRGVYAAASVSIDGGQSTLPFQPFYLQEGQVAGRNTWAYDANTLTLVIHLRVPVATRAGSKVAIVVRLVDSPNCPYLNAPQGFPGRLARLQSLKAQLDDLWHSPSMVYQDLYPNFLLAGETASRINSRPATARDELARFEQTMGSACKEMRNLKCAKTCDDNLITMLTAQLNC